MEHGNQEQPDALRQHNVMEAHSHSDEMNGNSQMDDTTNPAAPEAAEGDISLACRDCGNTFLFTVGEQEFYSMKGFEGPPTRCKPCRAQKKISREQADMSHPVNYMMIDGYGMPYYGYGAVSGQHLKPCHAFQRGNCMYGADCRYSHEQGGVYPMGYAGAYPMGYPAMDGLNYGGYNAGPPRRQSRSRNPCFAFQKGNCTFGDSCRYSHDTEAGGGGGGGGRLCHAFQQGGCKYGDSCRFVHEK